MADVDVAPALYSDIDKEFKAGVRADKKLNSLISKIGGGKANTKDVVAAATRIGNHASDALKAVLVVDRLPDGVLYWNIAEKTISPLMTNVHSAINNLALLQMRSVDKAASLNIGISKGVDPAERIRTIMGFATNSKSAEELANALDIPVKTTALDYVDDFEKENAKIRDGMGFEQYVVREYDGVGLNNGKEPCHWCLDRAGAWTYQEAIDNGVFERHEGCGCTIEVVREEDMARPLDIDTSDIPF